MSQNAPITLISCDEAGFTGPALLDPVQPYFVYASHDLTVAESEQLIADIRASHSIQATELKSQSLKRRNDWLAISKLVRDRLDGRVIVIAFDKKVALAGKVMEYLFEPVLEANNVLFYSVNFHRFMMNAVYEVISSSDTAYGDLALEMQLFMRTFDPAAAPSLFGESAGQHPEIMEQVLTFCRGYAEVISENTKHLRVENSTTGKWALDLTSTSLFSLLMSGWGHRHARLRVLCDESKPLQAVDELFAGFIDREDEPELHAGDRSISIKANLAGPIEFGSSTLNPTLQISDLAAGVAAFALREEVNDEYDGWVWRHMHDNYLMADSRWTDPATEPGKLGRNVLGELARRAKSGEDPLKGMPKFIGGQLMQMARRSQR